MANCIYCREQVAKDATYCKTCSHYQSRWKNWIPHAGGAIAIVTLLASLTTFAIRPLRDAYIQYTWKDELEIISFNSGGEISVKNSGDGDIFLEGISFNSSDMEFSAGHSIGITAAKGKFTRHELKGRKDTKGRVLNKGDEVQQAGVRQIYSSENDHRYNIFKDHLKDQMLTFPCEVKLKYRSLARKSPGYIKVACVGYYIHKSPAKNALQPTQ